MKQQAKELTVIVAVSILIFLVLKPKNAKKQTVFNLNRQAKKKQYITKPFIDDELMQYDHIAVSYQALCAYIDAVNNGDDESKLEALKDGFKKEIGIEIYNDANNMLAVRDLEGNDILVNS